MISGSGRLPGEENDNPLQHLSGKSHGQRRLAGYGPWGHKRVRYGLVSKQPQALGLEKVMATHSSILAWRIPGMEEPGGLQSMGSHRVGHD